MCCSVKEHIALRKGTPCIEWDFYFVVFESINQLPKESHGGDIMRIQEWHLAGNAKFYRQNIVLSSHLTPELNALFNMHCLSHSGRAKLQITHNVSILIYSVHTFNQNVELVGSHIYQRRFSTSRQPFGWILILFLGGFIHSRNSEFVRNTLCCQAFSLSLGSSLTCYSRDNKPPSSLKSVQTSEYWIYRCPKNKCSVKCQVSLLNFFFRTILEKNGKLPVSL